MATFSQTIFSDAFSWMKSFVFWLRFHWSLFLRTQMTITQDWFRIGDKPLSESMLTWFTDAYMRHYGRWVNGIYHSAGCCRLFDKVCALLCKTLRNLQYRRSLKVNVADLAPWAQYLQSNYPTFSYVFNNLDIQLLPVWNELILHSNCGVILCYD